jgi:hypothetical protein
MKQLFIAIIISLLLVGYAHPQGSKLDRTETSPLGDIIVEHYYNLEAQDVMATRQIWLVSKSNPKIRYLLYKHGRSADVLFSPDQNWLVINDFLGSNVSTVLLYKKKDELQYAEVKDAAIDGKAISLFARDNKLREPLRFAHSYVKVVRWADDSKAFLLILEGSLENTPKDNLLFFDPWMCVFDLTNFEVSLDLRLMNRDIFKDKLHQRSPE